MPFTPTVTAGIETALNTFLWRDKALNPLRQRLLEAGIAGPAAGSFAPRPWCWYSANARLTSYEAPGTEGRLHRDYRLSVLPGAMRQAHGIFAAVICGGCRRSAGGANNGLPCATWRSLIPSFAGALYRRYCGRRRPVKSCAAALSFC